MSPLGLSLLVTGMFALQACGGDADSSEVGAPEPPPERTAGWVTDGPVYTEAQAERGAQVFLDVCSTCHALDDFKQITFRRLWTGGTVADFYRFVSTAMPYNAPGSLEDQQYVDALAFIFRENGLPAGNEELPPDPARLREIHLEAP